MIFVDEKFTTSYQKTYDLRSFVALSCSSLTPVLDVYLPWFIWIYQAISVIVFFLLDEVYLYEFVRCLVLILACDFN